MKNIFKPVVKDVKENTKSPFDAIKPKEPTLPPLKSFEIPSKEELYQNSLAKMQTDELINYFNTEFKHIIDNQNLHIESAEKSAKSSSRQAKISNIVAIISILISLFTIIYQFNIFSLFK